MKAINRFLLDHDLMLPSNPCVSPDFCLNWSGLKRDLSLGRSVREHARSAFQSAHGTWHLVENEAGDHAWRLEPSSAATGAALPGESISLDGFVYFPATYENLIALKNYAQEFDSACTIFPTARGSMSKRSLGVGARFTTLHWPGVDWVMSALDLSLTANQNSIPRELVFDVDTMLAGELDTVPFPFIGASVPEGHQGQSVEGMSHGCILAKLKHGFHTRRIPWSFNADHQPIGGKFDVREDQLVAGCLFASYITFDLSPELALSRPPEDPAACRAFVETSIGTDLSQAVLQRVREAGIEIELSAYDALLCHVWPALRKMKSRDERYRLARYRAFSTEQGREYLRELSIDELPGLTEPATTAVMLALCEAMGMPVNFIAPAFGFQKNMPYPDNGALTELIERQWKICERFGVSLGFHSGSGKSAENYRVMGAITGGNLEIKTSGRYTYEMGVALSKSHDAGDQALWRDWYQFTRELALAGAFSESDSERKMARSFIEAALALEGLPAAVFESVEVCQAALAGLEPSPEHMFWFEYNFLYVLAAQGRSDKSALGDHSVNGYQQRARFYGISDHGRLLYAQRVADYLIFLAENVGLAPSERCAAARAKLAEYTGYDAFLADIAGSWAAV